MSKKPSLLLLSQILPFPPDAGVAIRTFNLIRELSKTFEITALCFHRSALGEDRDAKVSGLSEFADVRAFPIPQETSRARLAWDHVRSIVARRVYTRFVYRSDDFAAEIDRCMRAKRFDLVQLESLDLACYLPQLSGSRVVCVHHNVESELLRRRAAMEANAARRAYLRHQARLMEEEERVHCPAVRLNVAVSQGDAERLREIAPGASVISIPNGVDVEKFKPGDAEQRGVIFTGGTTWFPNRDALQFYTQEILPRIRRTRPDADTLWVGRASPEDKARHARTDGLELTGYVPDIRPYMERASCMVVPLRVGGGTRLKVLDAWAMGKAVVSTAVGCEGLAAIDGVNILIRDTPDEFAAAVCEVLGDEDLRDRLGKAGRETVEREYAWGAIGGKLRDAYLDLLHEAS